MKRILAVILTIVMLLGVVMMNTNAATHTTNTALPTATLVTNEGSPLDIDGTVTQDGSDFIFTLRFDNFITIQGIDVEIMVNTASAAADTVSSTEQNVITSVKTFNLPSACLGENEFDENYLFLGGHQEGIRFVDINITSKSRIVLGVHSPSSTASVTVKSTYADTGETLFKIETKPKDYEIFEPVVPTDVPTDVPTSDDEHTSLSTKTGYFIPYGGVYTTLEDEATFATKNTDGTFSDIKSDSKYIQFKLPKKIRDDNQELVNQLTAFGAATQIEGDAWKFGCYSTYDDITAEKTKTDMQHGTMIFDGDWLALKKYYIHQGNTVQQFVKAIYEDMTELEQNKQLAINLDINLDINEVDNKNNNGHHVTYNFTDIDTGEQKQVHVYKFPRKHYIWRDNKGQLEYAIRLHGVKDGGTYTSVAYCLGANETNFELAQISHNVKSITVPEGSEPK